MNDPTSEDHTALKRGHQGSDSNVFVDSVDKNEESPTKRKKGCLPNVRKSPPPINTTDPFLTTASENEDAITNESDYESDYEYDQSNKGADLSETLPSNEAPVHEITFDKMFNEFKIHPDERNELMGEYKRLLARFKNPGSHIQGFKEINQTLVDLQPIQDVVCLYVRFARQLPSNFNIDSICSLLSISKQCNYKPYIFLTKVKTLEVRTTASGYGISFWFYTRNAKDVDGAHLEMKFLGLKYTLKLLQSTISKSQAILGKVGMRQKAPRQSISTKIPIGDNEHISVPVSPVMEFHKHDSLVSKLWLGISHRWLAHHIVNHLFAEKSGPSLTTQQIFVYSVQMFAPCGRSRYDFLNPLVGFCLRFKDHLDIDANSNQLQRIRANPSLLYSFGNTCLHEKTQASKVQLIHETFSELKKALQRKCLYQSLSLETQWTVLRSYAFHFWLDQTKNHIIKSLVLKTLSTRNKNVVPESTAKSRAVPSQEVPGHSQPTIQAVNGPSMTPQGLSKRRLNEKGGLKKLLESRKHSTKAAICNNDPTSDQCKISVSERILMSNPPDFLELINNPKCEWSNFRLLTTDELNNFMASYLIIRRDDGIDIVSRLGAFEVYSANHLHKLKHCRLNGKPDFYPTTSLGQVVLNIGSSIDQFVDLGSKYYHVARDGSSMFREHGKLLPSIGDCASLCRSLICHGHPDFKRSQGQRRAFIGNGGQDHPNGIPSKIVDGGFMKRLKDDPTCDHDSILITIGCLTEFLWKTMSDLQTHANDSPLAPDRVRHSAYSKHLCGLLSMDDCVSFEDVTIAVSTIYPYRMDLHEHVDVMNDTVLGYTRTGALNMCFMIEEGDFKLGLHLQVIGNFRRIIRQYMVPFATTLNATLRHGNDYLQKWHRNMNSIFGGRATAKPDPFSREWFFLDNCLPYKRVKIYNGSTEPRKEPIHGEYLLCHIGLSRVLSMSLFIDQIKRTENFLKFDQRMELAFACSLLSNPFWFDTIMNELITAHEDTSSAFKFGLHPFFDWMTSTIDKFGTWQGGPYNRWSPCGGDTSIPKSFGRHPHSTIPEQELGISRLESIMEVLYHHVLWVDSLAVQGSTNPVEDLTISTIKKHMDEVCANIYNIVPCQFKLFRLCVFNTIMTGMGAFEPGSHLKQLMFPIPGSASHKHLEAPFSDVMSKEVAEAISDGNMESRKAAMDLPNSINVNHHDRLMQYLSIGSGRPSYVRDEMECLLCESHPNRDLENCCDWFRQNQSIYDCLDDGQIVRREYGNDKKWTVVPPSVKNASLAYIRCKIIYQRCNLRLQQLADCFGEELRDPQSNILFEGRISRTSDGEQYYDNNYSSTNNKSHRYCYKVANFYDAEYTSKRNIRTMKVLGHLERAQDLKSHANPLQKFRNGCRLMKLLGIEFSDNHTRDAMLSACYHQQIACDSQSKSIVFDGHIDKNFVHTAWFIPLTARPFYTMIAVPSNWTIPQDHESQVQYSKWVSTMSMEEKTKLENFQDNFLRLAKVFMKDSNVTVLIFHCSVGAFLSFPANTCYHATVTVNLSGPDDHSKFRDLLIVYPMVEG